METGRKDAPTPPPPDGDSEPGDGADSGPGDGAGTHILPPVVPASTATARRGLPLEEPTEQRAGEPTGVPSSFGAVSGPGLPQGVAPGQGAAPASAQGEGEDPAEGDGTPPGGHGARARIADAGGPGGAAEGQTGGEAGDSDAVGGEPAATLGAADASGRARSETSGGEPTMSGYAEERLDRATGHRAATSREATTDGGEAPAGADAGAAAGRGPAASEGSESRDGRGEREGATDGGSPLAPCDAHPSGLSARDRAVLGMARRTWHRPGAKERAIREELGMSPTRYYQLLNALLDTAEALAYDPVTVNRLRRVRDARRSRR